jgi:hypothetical protein
MIEGVDLIKIYCKQFYICHNVPPAQWYNDKNKINFLKMKAEMAMRIKL